MQVRPLPGAFFPMPQRNKQHSPASFNILAGLACELNAPLKSLATSSQKLLDEYKDRDFEYVAYKDFKNIITTLQQMNRQLKRCSQTTQQMMRLDKGKDHARSEPYQINAVIGEIIDLLGQQFKSARVKIITRLEKNLPLIAIDKVDCHQVVHNILINAVQAMPAGGKIKIRTSLNKNGNMVVLTIEDEGIGITPEHLSKVFEPFFTTKERGVEKSTGLGLSIVYAIVHDAGGNTHIQSSLRKGTTVYIDLPVFVRV